MRSIRAFTVSRWDAWGRTVKLFGSLKRRFSLPRVVGAVEAGSAVRIDFPGLNCRERVCRRPTTKDLHLACYCFVRKLRCRRLQSTSIDAWGFAE